jgi:hypothetical protein
VPYFGFAFGDMSLVMVYSSCLGGVVVSVLDTGLKDRVSKPG